jgi:transcriptional regulator with XRE-family HTH domain
MSQEQFGALVSLSDSYISQIETNKKRPTPETLEAISKRTGLDYEELLRLAHYLPASDDEDAALADPELDLLFNQLRTADLPETDLMYVKETIRLALKIRRERAAQSES